MTDTYDQVSSRIQLWREEILDPTRDESITPLASLVDSLEADLKLLWINQGVRVAAGLVKDHVLGERGEKLYEFLWERAERAITMEKK